MPYTQFQDRRYSVVVRFTSTPSVAAAQLRQAVRQLNPDLAIGDLLFMDQIADAAFSGHRFALCLVALFALVALALATFGMYGVISYSVNRRMSEFGLRMALGARPCDLQRMIVGQGLALAALGAAIGLAAAIAFGRLLSSLLYGVRATDPLTLSAAVSYTHLYPQADRLVRIYFQSDSQPKFPINPNDFLDFRQRNRSFESLAAMTRHDVQLSGAGDPAMLSGFQVSAGYFHLLGINPARGRDFSAEDELHGLSLIHI